MRVACRRLVWVFSVFALGMGSLSHAQTVTPAPLPVVKPDAPPAEANDLQAALAATAWDANARGPLLALDPGSVTPWTPQSGDDPSAYREDDDALPPDTPKPLALPLGRERLRVETTAAHFGRKVVRLGSLGVLAPTEMVMLNENPEPGDPYARLGRDEKFRMLAATFDASQWKAFGSESGLGLSQLDKDQQALFLSYLPKPLKLRRGVVAAGRSADYSGIEYEKGKIIAAVVLTEEQRRGVRVRLNLAARIGLVKNKAVEGGGGADYASYVVQAKPAGQTAFSILARDNNNVGARDAYGVTLSAKVPSRLKPGQIAFDAPALDARVSLAGAQTLGDLIKRIADATGLELYADPRIQPLTVWARLPDDNNGGATASVRAGDLLQGLCWCVTGAVRRVETARPDSAALLAAATPVVSSAQGVQGASATATKAPVRTGAGPAFVLTDAIAGVGARNARLYEWYEQGSQPVYVLQTRMKLKIQAQNPMQYLGWGKNDALALPSAVMDRIQAGWKTERGRYGATTIRTAQLGREQQALVQQAAQNYAAQPLTGAAKTAPTFKDDQVTVRMTGRMTLTVPGVGEVDDNAAMGPGLINTVLPPAERWSDNEEDKPASSAPVVLVPLVARGSALFVAPRDADGAVKAVQAAARRGLSQVWLSVDGDTAAELNLLPLQAGITAGKSANVAVYAVARVLSLGNHAGGIAADDVPESAENATAPMARTSDPVQEKASVVRADENASASFDVNIFGETLRKYIARKIVVAEASQNEQGPRLRAELLDYRRSDLPESASVIREKLLVIAKTPGLAGLVLHETAAPGAGAPKAPGYGADGAEGGYSPEMRLAFLRRTGCDPVDFSSDVWMDGVNIALPFFGSLPEKADGTIGVAQQWGTLRFEQNARLMTTLYQAIRASNPALPLLIQERADGLWWGTWDKAEVLPARRETRDNETASEAQIAKETAHRRLLAAYFLPREQTLLSSWVKPDPWPADSSQAFAKSINEQIKALPGAWDGVVFDLSDLPVGKALALFAAGVAKPGASAGAPLPVPVKSR